MIEERIEQNDQKSAITDLMRRVQVVYKQVWPDRTDRQSGNMQFVGFECDAKLIWNKLTINMRKNVFKNSS